MSYSVERNGDNSVHYGLIKRVLLVYFSDELYWRDEEKYDLQCKLWVNFVWL